MAFDNLAEKLAQRKAESLYRRRRVLQSPQGATVCVDGQNFLAFCSNDYLGLANDSRLKAAMVDAVNLSGVGSGASHLVNGHHEQHHLLEEELAEFLGVERVLCFSSGYMANIGTVNALLGKQDHVFEDRLNHASLLDAGLLSGARFHRYLHADVASLNSKLSRAMHPGSERLVITDGVFSMDGDVAPLAELAQACRQHDAWLMVDDAHGYGVIGKGGRGAVNAAGLSVKDVPLQVGTLGKAFGTSGAFVAGDETTIETLIQFARSYIYTTAMPPSIAAATRKSLQIVMAEDWRRQHLATLIAAFRKGCEQLGFRLMSSTTPIQPILMGTADLAIRWSLFLQEKGILITAIRPPTVPAGTSRLRITFTAAHTEADVMRLIDQLKIGLRNPELAKALRCEDGQ
ncbi:MAG: 8-amino-7-oxononanoate synthase [Hahellaceae bacterium]|nr:8-amino-7-oxononanoate synthase [Hahellaceae bacterium]MCP5211174.1 8-amino-7-oxononanoate synthase [Hahellaceae bacterium]